mgnify:CR=1 FL=1
MISQGKSVKTYCGLHITSYIICVNTLKWLKKSNFERYCFQICHFSLFRGPAGVGSGVIHAASASPCFWRAKYVTRTGEGGGVIRTSLRFENRPNFPFYHCLILCAVSKTIFYTPPPGSRCNRVLPWPPGNLRPPRGRFSDGRHVDSCNPPRLLPDLGWSGGGDDIESAGNCRKGEPTRCFVHKFDLEHIVTRTLFDQFISIRNELYRVVLFMFLTG